MNNNVNHPQHYHGLGGAEAKDVMRDYFGDAFMSDYWLGCAMKYLFRFKGKNGKEDLQKAKQCIDFLIESEYGKD